MAIRATPLLGGAVDGLGRRPIALSAAKGLPAETSGQPERSEGSLWPSNHWPGKGFFPPPPARGVQKG